MSVLVAGFGVSGAAAMRLLRAQGRDVTVFDDGPTADARRRAAGLGAELVESPGPDRLAALVAASELVIASPGIPTSHRLFELAAGAGVPVWSEVELAWRAIDVPVVAVTGTNGKTTVTTLVTRMLEAAGRRAVAAGNVGLPLSDVVGGDAEVVVVEVSSFQLELSPTFRPHVGVWLNFAEDHLDWHPDVSAYAAAKARIWANQHHDDVAVANAEDPEVLRWAKDVPARVLTFGLASGDYTIVDGELRAPGGETIAPVAALGRSRRHDLANALAASAAALAAGATLDGVRKALEAFGGLPHRLALVSQADGVSWYDDSKATNPHATVAAVGGFESVVLVAGGRNKGIDLSPIAEVAGRVRAVVAIGEAAGEVAAVFEGTAPVTRAQSMDEAVAAAAGLARPGDAVLLSPACASFDWYRSYAERGDDFARAVRARLGATP